MPMASRQLGHCRNQYSYSNSEEERVAFTKGGCTALSDGAKASSVAAKLIFRV